MKKLPVFVVFFAAAAIAIAAIPPAKSVVGKWVITYSNGTVTNMTVRANGTFTAEMPAEHYVVGGKYKFKGDVLKISDTSCNAAYWGTYKLTFHGADSIWSEVIADSCGPRLSAADKKFLIRQH